ncbi:hypothetical protein DBO93_02315 [Colwellia sp. Arc7-D]|nr:hypothetical protein DBO93_02315 [Colwellia sp. Arc7-D]
MDTSMTNNKKLLSTLLITLSLSACGSSSTDNETDKGAKEVMTQEQESSPEQAATKLVATPKLKGEKMEDVKQNLKDDLSGWQRGRVQFLNLEGGFYGIITDSGQKILPMNMAKEFAQNGAIVRIKGKVKNVMTIQQWGTPFTISEIELISPGNKVNDADM